MLFLALWQVYNFNHREDTSDVQVADASCLAMPSQAVLPNGDSYRGSIREDADPGETLAGVLFDIG